MRIPLVIVVVLAAVAPLRAQDAVPNPTADPEAFTRAVLEAWSMADIDHILTFYTDDIVYEDVPNVDNGWSTIHRGRDAFRQSLIELYAGMPDFAIEFESARAGDDHLVMEWTMTGTHTGDWEGLPATGGSISIRGISIAEIEDGRITRNRDYYDSYLFLVQLGVLPESLPSPEDPLP